MVQCKLLRRAHDKKFISYKNPIIALKKFRPLLEAIEPLDEKEAEKLRGYLRSLLPHTDATHMPLERFYAYAAAIESIAFRKRDKVRKTMHQLFKDPGGDAGTGSAPVPARRGPKPKPMSAETKPKPKDED